MSVNKTANDSNEEDDEIDQSILLPKEQPQQEMIKERLSTYAIPLPLYLDHGKSSFYFNFHIFVLSIITTVTMTIITLACISEFGKVTNVMQIEVP